MHNWDYNKTADFQHNPVWYLDRLLTYGLNGQKISEDILRANWDKIKIPETTRMFLELLLWDKPFSLPNNKKL
mgnify:CR=1 FL=1